MEVDYSDETVWREFQPARADLAFNVAMGITLVWLPLTASAVGRCAFVNYKVTDKRVCVSTNAPWSSASLPCAVCTEMHFSILFVSQAVSRHSLRYRAMPCASNNSSRPMRISRLRNCAC